MVRGLSSAEYLIFRWADVGIDGKVSIDGVRNILGIVLSTQVCALADHLDQ